MLKRKAQFAGFDALLINKLLNLPMRKFLLKPEFRYRVNAAGPIERQRIAPIAKKHRTGSLPVPEHFPASMITNARVIPSMATGIIV